MSFRETTIIAQKLNISLDQILIKAMSDDNKRIVLQLAVYPELGRHIQIEKTFDLLKQIIKEPYSELGAAISGMINPFFFRYKNIMRFYTLKYYHHNRSSPMNIPFGRIMEMEAELMLREEFFIHFTQISHSFYVWDRKIIYSLVNDIKYFMSVRLIEEEETKLLTMELYRFLDDFEKIVSEGIFEETGNKVELYVSDVDIDLTYAYIWNENFYINTFTAFGFFAIALEEEALLKIVMNRIAALKRCSTLISGVGDKERIAFFEQQRQIVNTLLPDIEN